MAAFYIQPILIQKNQILQVIESVLALKLIFSFQLKGWIGKGYGEDDVERKYREGGRRVN